MLYIYYDAMGAEAAAHREELQRFEELVARDGVRFEPMPVQDFIIRAFAHVRDDHTAYVDYLAQRYL